MCLQILAVQNIYSKKQNSRDLFSQDFTFFVCNSDIQHLSKEQAGSTLLSFQGMQGILQTLPMSPPSQQLMNKAQLRAGDLYKPLTQCKTNPTLIYTSGTVAAQLWK